MMKERVSEGGAIRDGDSEGMSAEKYGEIMKKRLWGDYLRFASRTLNEGQPPVGGRVLELGPGPGWISVIVSQKRPDLKIDLVDASPDMVRAARANLAASGAADRTRVFEGTAESVDETAPGPYDLVYSRDSLHHWNDPVKAFSRIHKILAPGGILVLQDERRDIGLKARALVAILSRLIGGMGRFWRSSIAAAYTVEELKAILAATDFSEKNVVPEFLSLALRAKK